MKQKFIISKADKATELTIREMSELDKESFTMVFEATYDCDELKAAAKESQDALIAVLRTHSLYPINTYMIKIAASVAEVVKANDAQTEEIVFNDADSLPVTRAKNIQATEPNFNDPDLPIAQAALTEIVDDDDDETDEEVDDLLDEEI